MRSLIICLVSIFLFCACNNHSNEKILRTFQSKRIYQSVSVRPFSWGNGFCGGSIWLNSDSTFTQEYGCEGRSHAIIGKWHIIGDSIELNPLKKSPKNISFNVTLSKTYGDSVSVFIVIDKTKKPIENFVIQPFTQKPNYLYSDQGLVVVNGKHTTSSLGIVKIIKKESDSLYFPKLYALTGKDYAISTDHLPDTIKININTNGIIFFQNQIKYEDINKAVRFPYINNQVIFKQTTQ